MTRKPLACDALLAAGDCLLYTHALAETFSILTGVGKAGACARLLLLR